MCSSDLAAVLDLFRSLHREEGYTLVVVTHEERVTAIAQRVIRLAAGRLVEDRRAAA